MANSPQAIKRIRLNEKRRLNNTSQASAMRTSIKKGLKLIQEGELQAAKAQFKTIQTILDKLGRRGLIHPNKAARLKSRLQARIQAKQAATSA